ncbi:MAG: type IV pilus twitching motility protein PilT [Bacillota bacterium]|nr:type IV pilus twitching motility protein PilT [Bacillota bacterium]
MTIESLLKNARAEGCSDIHITQGLPIAMRKHGKLLDAQIPLSPEETEQLILSFCSDEQIQGLRSGVDQDFALELEDRTRYRVNVYTHRLGIAAAIRLLNDGIPSLEELHLPEVLRQMADEPRGLILVTGPTGSGKSTTLAAMIDYISRTREGHILTVEDPIEYVFDQNKCTVHQRELGPHVKSFADALRSALREDPDIILVGEMRDYETISTAITAAETGHLVLSTLHTTGASQTIDRIIDTCPPEIQRQMRSQLSTILRGVITQQLLPMADGSGRIVATEVLVGTDAVGNMIREDKCHQLPTVMQSGSALGMHTLNGDLARLAAAGKISRDTAINASTDKKDLMQYLR